MNSRLRELLRVAWESQEELTMRVKLIISPSTTCMFGKSSEVRRTGGQPAQISPGGSHYISWTEEIWDERERERLLFFTNSEHAGSIRCFSHCGVRRHPIFQGRFCHSAARIFSPRFCTAEHLDSSDGLSGGGRRTISIICEIEERMKRMLLVVTAALHC